MAADPSAIPHPESDTLAALPPESLLREIISQYKELPVGVQNAKFSFVSHRLINKEVLQTVLGQARTDGTESEWADRIEKRKKNLGRFMDHHLVCVFIRLPGVHYTIEVDLAGSRVAHWEWQAI